MNKINLQLKKFFFTLFSLCSVRSFHYVQKFSSTNMCEIWTYNAIFGSNHWSAFLRKKKLNGE